MAIFSPKKEVTLESISNSIDFLVKNSVTKDDLNNDLDKLETKLIKRMDDLIDDLAISVNKGFVATDAKIDELEGRFTGLEVRFDTLEQKVDRLDTRMMGQFDYIMVNYPTRQEFKSIDVRTKKLERRVFA